MSAIEDYGRRIEAVDTQRKRFIATDGSGARLWDRIATRFRLDPRRELDPNLAVLASLVEPGDVVLDVGGGAGRVGLPLALRARALVNVEPSEGMGTQYIESADEAGIANATWRKMSWPPETGLSGDFVLVANVTYFVREIEPFVQALQVAARRRICISVWSVPPPDANAALFELLFGEAQGRVPGHRELLAALWEMGILPDVRVLPMPFVDRTPLPATREEAVTLWLDSMQPLDREAAAKTIETNFERLFRPTEKGLAPTWRPDAREMLITWETAAR